MLVTDDMMRAAWHAHDNAPINTSALRAAIEAALNAAPPPVIFQDTGAKLSRADALKLAVETMERLAGEGAPADLNHRAAVVRQIMLDLLGESMGF